MWLNGSPYDLGKFVDERDARNVITQNCIELGIPLRSIGANLSPLSRRSEFDGLTWIPESEKWSAILKDRGNIYELGIFAVEKDAARAINQKCREVGIAERNFIPSDEIEVKSEDEKEYVFEITPQKPVEIAPKQAKRFQVVPTRHGSILDPFDPDPDYDPTADLENEVERLFNTAPRTRSSKRKRKAKVEKLNVEQMIPNLMRDPKTIPTKQKAVEIQIVRPRKRKIPLPESPAKRQKLLPPDLPLRQRRFGRAMDCAKFWYPRSRLSSVDLTTMEAVNDHCTSQMLELTGTYSPQVKPESPCHDFPCVNDLERVRFYKQSLQKANARGKTVLEIGSGTGLLSMFAAEAGASHVYAIEACADMAKIGDINVRKNNLSHIISTENCMSTDFVLPPKDRGKVDIVISECIGTLLLGESQLDYIGDSARRHAKTGFLPIPFGGAQYIALVDCPALLKTAHVRGGFGGLDLSAMNALRDTCRMNFTKNLGCRVNSLEYRHLCERIKVFEVSFDGKYSSDRVPQHHNFHVQVLDDGVITCAICSWEIWGDEEKTISLSTHPEETKSSPYGFVRDMQWGQAIQFLEDRAQDGCSAPKLLEVKRGDQLQVSVTLSTDRREMQVSIERLGKGIRSRRRCNSVKTSQEDVFLCVN